MIPIRRALAAGVFMVAACLSLGAESPISPGSTALSAGNILSCPLPGDGRRELVAVNDPVRGAVWGLIVDERLFLPQVDLEIGGREVVSMDASPDGAWVGVVSVSEGHTEFEVFDAAEVRGMPLDGPPVILSPAARCDGYPANVFFAEWDGEWAVLIVDGEATDRELRFRPVDGATEPGAPDPSAPWD